LTISPSMAYPSHALRSLKIEAWLWPPVKETGPRRCRRAIISGSQRRMELPAVTKAARSLKGSQSASRRYATLRQQLSGSRFSCSRSPLAAASTRPLRAWRARKSMRCSSPEGVSSARGASSSPSWRLRVRPLGSVPAGSATAAARVAWRSTLVLQRSEIRLVSSRDCGVFFGAVFMWVFSTDILGPVAEYAPIGFGRGPNGCEDAIVLDRELEL
jgi:hypothetical protein